jgi:hypothetical protein
MPGLVRGMARTAAVVGTATATRNAYAQAEASVAPAAPSPQQYAPPPPAAPVAQEDPITQLERLGALKAQGLITEEEFNAQKAKILGM